MKQEIDKLKTKREVEKEYLHKDFLSRVEKVFKLQLQQNEVNMFIRNLTMTFHPTISTSTTMVLSPENNVH